MLKQIKKHRFEILCILPFITFLLIFTLTPIARVITLSFQSAPALNEGGWFTLAHYKALFSQKAFQEAFFNTLFIALVSLILEIALGLVLALLLSRNSGFRRFLRPLFILPLAIPTAVVGVIMGYLFSNSGWINRILTDLGLIKFPIYWMSGGVRSLMMVALADTWKVTPIVMLILLAGLQSIDNSLYKAARIDGAGNFYIFRKITLPLLMPSITAAVIIRGIDAFRIFALPLILMGQNLKVIGTYAYLEYAEFNNYYSSAASSVILLVMIFTAVIIYIKAAGRKGLALG
ncbi:MAG: sugar ABC transporter permease [Candidatus Omnitrophota bacterium]